ncbi:hypothetical protein [Xanthomarina sp. F2636L]|uniref:hypothetical protein n=1 Tax=Xanthomarina sp. F2636L TaxID=2996018 RepID=UPI00225E3232|nr:hypothetical protein [Xanthomarina sp. F2636L]MCX7549278.1 hypothetical protein [Xanthomarina sp. F2636L]
MIKNNLFYLALLISLITNLSCSKDDDSAEQVIEQPVDNFYIESYQSIYAQYNIYFFPNLAFSGRISFEYDEHNRITKRHGDILHMSSNGVVGGYLDDSLYIDLTYANNKVYLEKKASPFIDYQTPENETIIELDENSKMILKTAFQEYFSFTKRDTTNYTYNDGKLRSFIKTTYRVSSNGDWMVRYFDESNLHYTNDNLDSIVTIFLKKKI